jgi:hypothetical protein
MSDQVPDSATCLGCGYSLRGLPEAVCPECGRGFDPEDPTTFRRVPARPWWPFQANAPPRWQVVVLPALTVVYVYWSSEPGGLLASVGFGACVVIPLGLAGAAILALDFVGRIVAVKADRKRALSDRRERHRGGLWRWLVLPAFLAVILSAVLWPWPLQTRFHFSQPAFAQAVRRIQAGTDPNALRGRIGLYEVGYIHRYESGAIFFQTGLSGFDKVGIAYRPTDAPCRSRDKRLALSWFTEMW